MILRGNLQRTNFYETKGLSKSPNVKWRFNYSGKPNRSLDLLIYDNWIYFGSDGYFFGLDLQTGKEYWRTKPGGSCSQIEGDTIYCRSIGSIFALERMTGKIKKEWPVPNCWGAPIVVDNVLYYGSLNGFFALDLLTDKEKWRCGTAGWGQTTPAFLDNKLYFGSYGGRLYSVYINNGRKQWTFGASERINTPPAISDGKIFFGCEHGNFHALDIRTGREIWEYPVGKIITAPVVAWDMVYFGIWDNQVIALDQKTGRVCWTFETESRGPSHPTIVGKTIYFGDGEFRESGGRIYALSAESGQQIWNFEMQERVWSTPVISNGILYVGSGDGYVYALE